MTQISALDAYLRQSSLAQVAAREPKALSTPLVQEGSGSFGQSVREAVASVQTQSLKSEAALGDFVGGQGQLLAIIEAVNETEVALETFVSLRDRMIEAYREIANMPI